MKYLTIAFHASNLKRKKRGVVVDGIREGKYQQANRSIVTIIILVQV